MDLNTLKNQKEELLKLKDQRDNPNTFEQFYEELLFKVKNGYNDYGESLTYFIKFVPFPTYWNMLEKQLKKDGFETYKYEKYSLVQHLRMSWDFAQNGKARDFKLMAMYKYLVNKFDWNIRNGIDMVKYKKEDDDTVYGLLEYPDFVELLKCQGFRITDDAIYLDK